MTAEIIAVGTELLLGDILNTNAQFLAKELSRLGIDVYFQTVVGDNPNRIESVIKLALSRSDIVITSGGLGPTHDDLTKETIANVLGLKLTMHKPSLEWMESYFKSINRPMADTNIKQAMLPKDCIVLSNTCGTAPGGIIEKDGKTVIFLPGPPREITAMFKLSVYPYLFNKSNEVLHSKTIKIFGMGESSVEKLFSDYMKNAQNPTVAPYAKEGEVHLRITAKSDSVENAKSMIRSVEEKLREKLGELIYGTDTDTLPSVVLELLNKNCLTIAFAESCTGGLLSSMITDIPGASNILKESIVTYSNEAKVKYLGVKKDTIDNFGAVSKNTAIEMAEGIKKASGADIGVGITGIAGPGGGSEYKPVGLVYIGIAAGEGSYYKELRLNGSRQRIRNKSCLNALDEVRKYLTENY